MSEPAQADVFPLWPTWIGQLQLPGAEEHRITISYNLIMDRYTGTR